MSVMGAGEKNTILIASSSVDEHAYGPVSEILKNRGYPVVVYKSDQVISGHDDFRVEVTGSGSLYMEYEGQSITPDALGAAWYRKIGNFVAPGASVDRAKQLYINNEVRDLHDTIWPLLPDGLWLNSPDKMRSADRKLSQLLVAKEVGFSVPSTMIGSNWDDIRARFLSNGERMIIKMLRGIISEGNELKGMYTTPVSQAELDQFKDFTVPFPGLYQPFIKKEREWRVTTIGDDVFAAAIYTDEDAKDDWRKHQLTNSVKFEEGDLPDGVGEKCLSYLGKMGLRFGAFDFIEKPDGEVVFLECNPNGQYGWLEQSLGFPISEAIANELVAIAKA